MELIDHLREYVRRSSITGREEGLARYLLEAWAPWVDEAWVDRVGNYVGLQRGTGGPRVLAAVHLDSIGLMVTRIEPGGFLRFLPVGGVDRRYLLGQEVEVLGRRPVPGVIGARPPHLTRPEEREKIPSYEELYIDTGLPEEEVRQLIAVGDPVVWRQELVELRNGRVAGRYLDNRASLAALWVALVELRRTGHGADFYAVGTVGEEFGGLPGAATAPVALGADVVIAVDVTFGEHHGAKEDHFPLDGGPTILVGPNAHPALARLMREVARREGIPHQVEVAADSSGTDAWAMQVAGDGALSGVISIPLRYMHNPTEVVSLEDIRQAGLLLARVVAAIDRAWLEEALAG
ncbi:MAG: M20/M25/M40 family metallo-hydrolase [Firmicutes bacterium]|nr:M20/M25/M40 family metallo-hydrolase [Bacillota bacterium]